jgi:hypothetical protein
MKDLLKVINRCNLLCGLSYTILVRYIYFISLFKINFL